MKSNTQTMTLAQVLRPLITFFTYLLTDSGRQWLTEFNKFLRKQPSWITEPKFIFEKRLLKINVLSQGYTKIQWLQRFKSMNISIWDNVNRKMSTLSITSNVEYSIVLLNPIQIGITSLLELSNYVSVNKLKPANDESMYLLRELVTVNDHNDYNIQKIVAIGTTFKNSDLENYLVLSKNATSNQKLISTDDFFPYIDNEEAYLRERTFAFIEEVKK